MLLLTDLKKFKEYSVSVSALTNAGAGPFSSHQIIRTMEDGILLMTIPVYAIQLYPLSLFTVPDMPRDLSAELVNGSSVMVKWQHPLNVNGILLGYQVIYQGEKVY